MSIYFVLALRLLNGTSLFAARVVLALYALELGAQPFAVGLLAATFSVFPMVIAMPTGKLADRFGSRWLLIFGAAGAVLSMLIAYRVPGLPAIFVAAAMIGLSGGIYNVSLQNLVGLLSKPHNRTLNFSNNSLMGSIAMFLGPLIAGFSIDHSGHATACLFLALLALVPVAMLAIWGDALPGVTAQVAPAKGGIRAMLSGSGVRRTLATSSLLNVGQDLYQFYIPIYGHTIGLSASTIGIVLSMNAAAAFVMRLALARLIAHYKEEKLLAYAFFVGAASLMLIPFFKSAAMLALISFLFGLGMGCGGPIVTMLMFSNSPEGRSGEALGLRMTVTHLTKLVGPVVFGSIGSAFGLLPMFWLNALLLASGGMLSSTGAIDRDATRR